MKKSLLHKMFSKLRIITAMGLLAWGSGGRVVGQVYIICGANNGTSGTTAAMPINVYYEGNRIQWIITAAEISSGGWAGGSATISNMYVYLTNPPDYTQAGYSVRMKNTAATNTATHDGTGLTTVVGPITANFTGLAPDWYGYTFTTNFTWDGTSNILVDVCFGENANWSSTGQIQYTTLANGSKYERADNSGSLCGATTTTNYGYKPRTQFEMKPTNDNCSGTTSLTVYGTSCGGATTGNVQGATQSLAGCTGTADEDVWYSFVATATSHDITVDGSTIFDAVVQFYSGTCGSLTSITCADATGDDGIETINATGLTVSSTYYVRVYEYWSGAPATTTFTICVTTPCTAPGATTLSSHSNTTTSLTWNWNAASGATGYDISYDGGAWTANGAGTTYAQSSGITANTQHRLNVRATNGCGTGTAMGDQYFYSSQNTPTSITFSSIVGNSITATANGTFPNQASGSSGVYIRNTTNTTNSTWMTATTTWVNGTPVLVCGTTYSYYAKARNGDGDETTEIGPTTQATTACPGSVTLNNPFDNYRKTYNIDFDWTASPANYYNIIVDDNYSFASPVYDVNQAGNTYTISATLTTTYTYYWKVRASNDGGSTWGNFSTIRSFTYDSGITTADWYQNCYNQFNQGSAGGTDNPVIENAAEADPPTDNSRIQLPP